MKTYSYKRLLTKNFISQPSVFFTREIYKKIGPISLDCQYSMDYDLLCRLLQRTTVRYCPSYVSTFRIHNDSKTSKDYWEFTSENLKIYKKYRVLLENIDKSDADLCHLMTKRLSYLFRSFRLISSVKLFKGLLALAPGDTCMGLLLEIKRLVSGGRYFGRS